MSRALLEAERALAPAADGAPPDRPVPDLREPGRLGLVPRPRDTSWLWVGGVLAGASVYATLRYNMLKGVPWADWPSYTLNKALAFASIALIALAVFRLAARRSTSVVLAFAGALGFAHSLLSFALFNPIYYPRFFEAGKLTLLAGASATLGVAAAVAMEVGARRSGAWSAGQRSAALAIIALAAGAHAALPALPSWFAPSTWPGWLPPITLLSFLCGCAAALSRLRRSTTHR